MSCDLLEKKLE